MLASTTLMMVYDTKLLDGVSASSVPPSLPHGVRGELKLEKACDKTRIVLRDEHGFIASGPEFSNYTQNSHCEWLIRPFPAHPPGNSSKTTKNDTILSDSSTHNSTGNRFLIHIIIHQFTILKKLKDILISIVYELTWQ